MENSTESLIKQYQGRSMPGLSLDDGMLMPAYDGHSIANIPGSICRWLGGNDWPTVSLDEALVSGLQRNYRQVILLVMDGLGWELLQRLTGEDCEENKRWREVTGRGLQLPLTSITPSTTSAALVSFWTGRPPSQHGVTGYEMWLREYNLAANMITHSPAFFEGSPGSLRLCGFNPETFLNVETLGAYLGQMGVQSTVLQSSAILGSGLSTMIFSGARQVPVRSMHDLFYTLESLAIERTAQRRYLYGYWGNLDELQHIYGPEDGRVEQEFHSFQNAFSRFLKNVRKMAPGDTLIAVTADHGLTGTPIFPDYEARRMPELLKKLHLLPTGESRLPYLHVRPGEEQAVEELVEQTWPGKFFVMETQKAIDLELFGRSPYHPELNSRLGDLVLISRSDAYLYWQIKENRLLGRHGGLSSAEMLVPLLLFEC